jgi:hypothetical protein
MIGAAAGAVTNKKDPLKGALLGATLGYGGGTLAPGLLGTGAAAGTAAGAGGTFIPAAALETQLAAAPAAPSLLSRVATPQTLLAGAQLAGAMTPRQAQTQAMPVSPGKPIPMAFQPPPMAMSPVGRYGEMFPLREDLGAFGVPTMFRTQVRPGEDEMLLNYFPGRR